jgi:hypothetical protein
MKRAPVDKLLSDHQSLTHTENMKVVSHVQREEDDWLVNTLMLEGIDVSFQFKRKKAYKNLKGSRVNLTYYPVMREVAGMQFETMKVVRIRVS